MSVYDFDSALAASLGRERRRRELTATSRQETGDLFWQRFTSGGFAWLEHPPPVKSLRRHAELAKRSTVKQTRRRALGWDAEARKAFEGDSVDERVVRLCRDGMLFSVVGRNLRVSRRAARRDAERGGP